MLIITTHGPIELALPCSQAAMLSPSESSMARVTKATFLLPRLCDLMSKAVYIRRNEELTPSILKNIRSAIFLLVMEGLSKIRFRIAQEDSPMLPLIANSILSLCSLMSRRTFSAETPLGAVRRSLEKNQTDEIRGFNLVGARQFNTPS